MNIRRFKHLKRTDLYEIILAQNDEINRLRETLNDLESQLTKKEISIKESGTLAEAALRLTNIFEEAQKAADLYLENAKQGVSDDDEKE